MKLLVASLFSLLVCSCVTRQPLDLPVCVVGPEGLTCSRANGDYEIVSLQEATERGFVAMQVDDFKTLLGRAKRDTMKR